MEILPQKCNEQITNTANKKKTNYLAWDLHSLLLFKELDFSLQVTVQWLLDVQNVE